MPVYSDDRRSLAQEIAGVLKSRNHWVPSDPASPDLINAVLCALLEERKAGQPAHINAVVKEALACLACDDQGGARAHLERLLT